jgi:hypothetical protein
VTYHVIAWSSVALMTFGFVGMACTVYGYSREVSDLRAERDADYAELSRRIDGLTSDHGPATGPINVLDRPTPAQIGSPTVPDLEAQHPKVPHGSTAVDAESYGRHANKEMAA